MILRGIYGIADRSAAPDRDEVALGQALLGAGVCALQIRMKFDPDDAVAAVVAALLPRARAAGVPLLVNDRIDVAARFSGVGVHLGQSDGDPREARRRLGPHVLVGWSTHGPDDVRAAAALPLDYIGFGPVFSASGKHRTPGDARRPLAPRGIDGLREACALATVPVVAIGGIDIADLPAVREAGAACAAVIAAVTAAPDPTTAAAALVAAWHHGGTAPRVPPE